MQERLFWNRKNVVAQETVGIVKNMSWIQLKNKKKKTNYKLRLTMTSHEILEEK